MKKSFPGAHSDVGAEATHLVRNIKATEFGACVWFTPLMATYHWKLQGTHLHTVKQQNWKIDGKARGSDGGNDLISILSAMKRLSVLVNRW